MDTEKKWERLSWLIFIMFLLSIVPIVFLMFYAHPYADEYTETYWVHLALVNGEGISGMLKGAWKNMADNYIGWQGTYFAEFVMALNPSVAGDSFYWTGIVTVFAATMLEHFYFFHVLLIDCLKMRRSEWLIISSLIILLGLNFMPDPMQGIYWYESASYYMGIYGLGLLSLAMCIRMLLVSDNKKRCILLLLSTVTAFLAAGGSMQSGLMFIFAFIAVSAAGMYKKNTYAYMTVLPLAAMTGGFLISVLAPGNYIRGDEGYSGIGPLMAIYKAVHQACVYLDQWNSLFLIAVFCGLFIPICFKAVRRSDFHFPLPALVTLYLCGMFACQFTPSYYAYDLIGPLRTVNPIYCNYLILLFIGIYYWCGWINHRFFKNHEFSEEIKESVSKWYFREGILSIVLLFGLGCIASDKMSFITGVSALTSLANGEAKVYDHERDLREAIYLENSNTDNSVEVMELTAKPFLLHIIDGEVKDNKTRWINTGISSYYSFKDVILISNDSTE